MKMKKMLLGAFLGMFTFAGVTCFAQNYQNPGSITISSGFDQQSTDYNPGVKGASTFQGDSLLKTIQKAINWVLGVLSFVALVLCLWGGFQMMTSGGDQAKYQKGLDVLKWAAIGLAIIACSWLIVSLIFYVINGSSVTNGTSVGSATPKKE